MRSATAGWGVAAALVVLGAGPAARAADTAGAAAAARESLKWKDAGIPGVKVAVVQGDQASGPSHFYLKYPAGFVAPRHSHSPDHFATTVSGQLVLLVDGKEQRLPPGSYFAFRDKAVHAARCEGSEDCVMFIDARGAWDVVPAKP
jgi:quercetin dioxygenase-like cupin family protein